EAAKAVDLAHNASLYVAGNTIAAVMDKGIGVGHSDNYHSAKHCCEELLGTLFLARLAALTPREQAQVVFCALVHDFHHDTHADGLNPFQQELRAVSNAHPYLVGAGVSPEEIDRIAALILATEINFGVPFARACYARHFGG